MDEFRVIKYFAPHGEYLSYAIGIPASRGDQNHHPIIHYMGMPGWAIVPHAESIPQLRKALELMLAALDKPVLYLSPERLVPAKLEQEEP